MRQLSPSNKPITSANWLELDAKHKVLGRLASEVAIKLMGKDQVGSKSNQVTPINIVITNTDQVVLTGKKEEQKYYYHHTGYPGGLKQRNVAEQRKRDSRVIIKNAVSGMLPKNKLRAQRLARLHLVPGSEHPYKQQTKPVKS